jgi:hypothetical protein
MSDVFDEAIDRQSPPNDPARIAAVIASDPKFVYFGTAAFAVRLLRLDQKIASGVADVIAAHGEHPQHCCFRNSPIGFRSTATRR